MHLTNAESDTESKDVPTTTCLPHLSNNKPPTTKSPKHKAAKLGSIRYEYAKEVGEAILPGGQKPSKGLMGPVTLGSLWSGRSQS